MPEVSPIHRHVRSMTLEEKAGLVSGAAFWETRAVERLGIPAITLTDGPHGVRLQRQSVDHLGIFASEPATSFPTASATGSSWDPELLAEMGRALGAESRVLGVDVLLGPGVNIKRSPLCGRNFEYFSEDPFHSGAMGAALVRGIESQGVGASVKHFAANNQETDRMRVNVEVDERTLREIYFPAFERVVRDARPSTVMCAYNRVNGVFASQHRWLLTDVLRGDWGFDGYVVSDWGAVVDPPAAVEAGLDLEMPSTGDRSPRAIVAAVQAGELDEAVLDQAVSRLLTVHERLIQSRTADVSADFDEHHELARRIAADSAVLLANESGILPLSPSAGGDIAVIGEFALTPRYQGAGSSHINPTRLTDALTSIREATSRAIRFAPGFTFDGEDDAALHDQAVEVAARSEVVVLFLGLPASAESEGFDRTHLLLPETQRTLLRRVAEANHRVVVVLSNGGVVALGEIAAQAPAILEMWLGGQATGEAAADLLFGVAEPGGRLAETIPVALPHTPAYINWPGENGVVRYGEGLYVGYRWYDKTEREVGFPFGFGLGYTTFAYTDMKVSVPDPAHASGSVEVTVANTGDRSGADVVQVYVGDPESSVNRPVRELKGFAKVRLNPGERRTVRIDLDERAFAFWGPSGWTVEPGVFVIEAGPNSRDLPLREEVVLEVPAVATILDRNSTLEEWIRHPSGAKALQGAMAAMGQMGGAMASEEMLPLFGSMPLRTVLNFALQSAPETFDVDTALGDLLAQVEPV
ncbi:glycoside hydrolase family 3 C-terminal domain-containing protein [Naasia sp. SYSU D00948]|uniref:glycoside hydrolase family 3 C-terminal domain-containing protein n=1 Tax=Naasia sp. SYSU D00948 TaxID=2817379 RepID=UPI001B302787|nr:glycoside hydrolase family 3 C-terminal domain-containing protein [Naasia sp. SYSU D00948]